MASRDISFTSFNLLNLQLPGAPLYNGASWTQAQYDRKIAFTGASLSLLSADFIGFQELWAPAALAATLAEAGLDSTHRPLTPPDHSGSRIVCAGAVRSDMLVSEPEWITQFPEEMILSTKGDDPQQPDVAIWLREFSRPVLHVRLQPREDTPVIHVFVCHFKSRRPTQVWNEAWYDRGTHSPHTNAIGYALSTIRRTAEATALRIIITKLVKNSDTPVVVIGDMNDGKDSNTLNILSEQPTFLSPLSSGGGDNALYTAQTIQEYRSVRDVYYTHVYKGQRESLDHVLFSQEFYDNSKRRIWAFDDMVVLNDHLDFDDHKDSGTNDHGILRVRFKWKPAEGAAV
ncbi:endonuclease/exonuclease/phosphatase family protein [Aliishimia ponticola]|uniref:Endonuclease/exonuclease/phosphatase family protein n=1 Tax=Aliishimia ponticola TaxID=2499833 RepID=A0A4V3XKH3_9RHOB|nr:endonuclease/exonuclease/phosphatase family protein [Aliishimia ponticola]THH36963.1 endonuclease/exonuclease/phosphatase family protein [Aliishimia ponticola]